MSLQSRKTVSTLLAPLQSLCTYERRLQRVHALLQSGGYCSCPKQGCFEDLGKDWRGGSSHCVRRPNT